MEILLLTVGSSIAVNVFLFKKLINSNEQQIKYVIESEQKLNERLYYENKMLKDYILNFLYVVANSCNNAIELKWLSASKYLIFSY